MGASLVDSSFCFFFSPGCFKAAYFFQLFDLSTKLPELPHGRCHKGWVRQERRGGRQTGCLEIEKGSRQPGSMCRAAEGGRSRADGKND